MGKINDFEVEFSRSIKKLMEALAHIEMAIIHQKKIIIDDSKIINDIASKLLESNKILENKNENRNKNKNDEFDVYEIEEFNELIQARELRDKLNSILKDMNKFAMHSIANDQNCN
ncbi:MAG: hypothetical protein HQK51_07770 [Oligoflexia bacterium]|nr:hypothetical protein [Oligoflexia bacterium]